MPHARGGAKNMPAAKVGIFFYAHFFSGGVIRAAENAQCRTGVSVRLRRPGRFLLKIHHTMLYYIRKKH